MVWIFLIAGAIPILTIAVLFRTWIEKIVAKKTMVMVAGGALLAYLSAVSNFSGTLDGMDKLIKLIHPETAGPEAKISVESLSGPNVRQTAPTTYIPVDRPAIVANSPGCDDGIIVEMASDRRFLELSRSSLIRCLERTDCQRAAASVCNQAGNSGDIDDCSRQPLNRISSIDRRELAVQFEDHLCFREALTWIVGSKASDMKAALARWKKKVCNSGRSDLLGDMRTQQTLLNFGVSDPSYDRDTPWTTCTAY
ncbi:hypothetical protein PMI42_00378 [Bradyrhizobium sp. YR681]|uniref:hypothetical protein n=1 Tax=Bradyrhizobium sp. YR681 TaxID=1144344 RepID=UPI0002711B3E|nr:hypothetical protein [Bradyrhizobium sp. YR681]EJN16051.1 hypothetical protein PMI42_00378 [Bradyrhizobium sp. YR681]